MFRGNRFILRKPLMCVKCKTAVKELSMEGLGLNVKFTAKCHGEIEACTIPVKEFRGAIYTDGHDIFKEAS